MKIPTKGSVVVLTKSIVTTDENDHRLRIPKKTRCHVESVRYHDGSRGLAFELTPEGYRTWFFVDQRDADERGGDYPFELVPEGQPAVAR